MKFGNDRKGYPDRHRKAQCLPEGAGAESASMIKNKPEIIDLRK
jgi:hypothetical protein